MPETVAFTVEGAAVAKGRTIYSPLNRTHRTPRRTVQWEAWCRLRAAEAMAGAAPLLGPVTMSVVVVLPVPSSWSKKKQDMARLGEVWPTGRPDLDNYIKAVSDACNGIVFRDDSQICRVDATKRYGPAELVEVAVRRPA